MAFFHSSFRNKVEGNFMILLGKREECVKKLSNCDFDEQRRVFIKRWYGDGDNYER